MNGRMSSAVTGLRLAVRGLWYRRSTALIVFVLAGVASAAAVVAPLYSRAAEESIVRDTLLQTDAYSRGVHASHPQTADVRPDAPDQPSAVAREAQRSLTHPAFGPVQIALQTRGSYRPVAGPLHGGTVVGRVVERTDVCMHLPTLRGRCPRVPTEGIATRRTLTLLGSKVGDTLRITLDELSGDAVGVAPPTLLITIVGSFDPVSVNDAYWVGEPYFNDYFPEARTVADIPVPGTADPVFLAPGSADASGISGYTVDVPVLPDRVHLGDGPTLERQVDRFEAALGTYGLTGVTALPATLDQASNGRDLVRIASPLAVTQLVLLAWWTLFLVVGSATEERSPELGLAKLRGLSQGQTARFGLAEIVLLLVVAAPLSTVAGYLAVRAAGPHVFAPGTHVAFTSSVLLTVSIALSGGGMTAALAARRIFRRPVGDLLRRVPSRGRARAGTVLEGAVVTLAVAGVVQLVSERGDRPSPVALLAPGMVAVVGGLLAARLLVSVARSGAARAAERGKAARLIGWCGVARRPGTARITAVLAIATCLLLVGVEAWTVAERNRVERSSAEVGSAVVLKVRAIDAGSLLSAVRKADPGGRFAMAAVEVSTTNQQDIVLAVDSTRADHVLRWGPPGTKPKTSIPSLLTPPVAPSILLRPGRLEITATVGRVRSPSPVAMAVRLNGADATVLVRMGTLVTGRHTYSGEVPQVCTPTCRFAAVSLSHPGTDIAAATIGLSVQRMVAASSDGKRLLDTTFSRPGAWRAADDTAHGGPQVTVRSGGSLNVDVVVQGGVDAEVLRGDVPDPLPAYAGSDVSLDSREPGSVPTVTAGGLAGTDTHYRVARSGALVPRAGRAALLVDLELALRSTDSAPEGERQVWLSRDDRAAERTLIRALAAKNITILSRETAAAAERRYAGNGAVLALRLLLICGAAAVVVSVGALLVAAYIGRRQRAYEVAALRVVGLSRRTVRAVLLRETFATVLLALASGGVAALVATWVVLPSLPQFDTASDTVAVRYAPDAAAGWAALGGLGLILAMVGVAVTALQLRAGHVDRLREGAR
jgi:hypothetical protein